MTIVTRYLFLRSGSSDAGLWITADGTAANSFMLATAPPFIFGSNASFANLGSDVLFNWVDPQGKQGLWKTDGTVTGTSEIPVTGASPTPAF